MVGFGVRVCLPAPPAGRAGGRTPTSTLHDGTACCCRVCDQRAWDSVTSRRGIPGRPSGFWNSGGQPWGPTRPPAPRHPLLESSLRMVFPACPGIQARRSLFKQECTEKAPTCSSRSLGLREGSLYVHHQSSHPKFQSRGSQPPSDRPPVG